MPPRNCPICGDRLDEGFCLNCGYDAYVDDFEPASSEDNKKQNDSLLDAVSDFLEESLED